MTTSKLLLDIRKSHIFECYIPEIIVVYCTKDSHFSWIFLNRLFIAFKIPLKLKRHEMLLATKMRNQK